MFTIDKRHMDKLLAQQTMCLPQKYVPIFLSGIRYYGIFLLESQPIRAKNSARPGGFRCGHSEGSVEICQYRTAPEAGAKTFGTPSCVKVRPLARTIFRSARQLQRKSRRRSLRGMKRNGYTEMRWHERMIPFSVTHSSVGTSTIINSTGRAGSGTIANSYCGCFDISPERSRRIFPPIRISRSRLRNTTYIECGYSGTGSGKTESLLSTTAAGVRRKRGNTVGTASQRTVLFALEPSVAAHASLLIASDLKKDWKNSSASCNHIRFSYLALPNILALTGWVNRGST